MGEEGTIQLFQALAKGDQNHIKTLQEMITNIK